MSRIEPVFMYGLICSLCILIGVWVCDAAGRYLGEHDHPAIVWDEIVGMQITLILVPVTVFNLVAGFLLFRLLDIVKPWPIKWIDRRLAGGLGVMLDDIAAGALAAAVLFGLSFF